MLESKLIWRWDWELKFNGTISAAVFTTELYTGVILIAVNTPSTRRQCRQHTVNTFKTHHTLTKKAENRRKFTNRELWLVWVNILFTEMVFYSAEKMPQCCEIFGRHLAFIRRLDHTIIRWGCVDYSWNWKSLFLDVLPLNSFSKSSLLAHMIW